MTGTRNDRILGTFHFSWLPDRIVASQLTALMLVLLAALITAGCGASAQAAGSQNALSLSAKLPNAITNQTYNAVLNVSGGHSPYHFAVKSGSLPHGLTLNPTTGSISGRPASAGSYSFEVMVTDAPLPDEGVQSFAVTVGGGTSVKISVSPASATVGEGQKQQFTATVSGTADTAVTWSASAGSIDAQGLYTAPAVTAQMNVTVTAASKADSSRKAYAVVTVDRQKKTQPPTIADATLPQGHLGSSYNETFTATGGTEPYSWSISAGKAPAGITLTADGQLSGLPATIGKSSFTVSVKDAAGLAAQHDFSVDIASGGNFDGPAELPRVKVASTMADTPAHGAIISVNAGADLQAALNSAHCGDTVELQAGATFSGKFVLPAKSCDSNHWIIVRTSAADNVLPAEGQRLTPCYAGVASLTGRPHYACSNPHNVLARIQLDHSGDGAIKLADGANHYRILGLEIMRPAGVRGGAKLILAENVADHIVLDRSWLHGALQDETHAGIGLNGTSYVAVVDSYFSDFHCISRSGTCTDAHAVSGGVSDTQDGPFKIENNFLEASGESVMFGGGAATKTPTDIEIRHNHFFKPWQWKSGEPGFVGGSTGDPFVVKNHLELKNAIRVLIEGNLLENNWGGFSQSGYGILLCPKNQHTQSGANVCPLCQVTDVTVRYSQISHAGGGIQLTTAISGDGKNGAPALAGTRWSLHDLVIDDLSRKYVGGGTVFAIMNAWPKNPLNTITINHVTAFPALDSHLMIMGNLEANQDMYGLVFTNNLVMTGQHPVWNTGGGPTSCAYEDVPVKSIAKCFTSYVFKNNALVSTPPAFPASSWPAGNMFPATPEAAGLISYNNGDGGNYALRPGSPYKNKGTDGKDLGADITGLNTALAGVE
jgi:hypothetical protein